MADDIDTRMKALGYPGGGGGKSAGADTAQAGTAEPVSRETGRAPTYDEMDWQQKMGQGVAKNLAGVATGVPRLINKGIGLVSPGLSETLGDYAERIPGVKRMEDFAQSASEGPLESIGSGLTTAATLVAGPGEWKVGEKLAERFARGAPVMDLPGTFRTAPEVGGQFSFGWPGGITGLPTRGERIAKGVGNVAEGIGRGAVSGAVAQPDDPLTGGIVGGVTGGAARPLGNLLRSDIGQMGAGHAARGITWAAVQGLGHMMGVPAHVLWAAGVPEAILFWHSPLGKMLHGGGRRAAELLGRVLQQDPRITAGAASKFVDFLLNSQQGQDFREAAGQEFGNYVMGRPAGTAPAELADAEPEGS